MTIIDFDTQWRKEIGTVHSNMTDADKFWRPRNLQKINKNHLEVADYLCCNKKTRLHLISLDRLLQCPIHFPQFVNSSYTRFKVILSKVITFAKIAVGQCVYVCKMRVYPVELSWRFPISYHGSDIFKCQIRIHTVKSIRIIRVAVRSKFFSMPDESRKPVPYLITRK